jgi:hypothetical protein
MMLRERVELSGAVEEPSVAILSVGKVDRLVVGGQGCLGELLLKLEHSSF